MQNIDTREEKVVVVGSYIVSRKNRPERFSYAAPFVASLNGSVCWRGERSKNWRKDSENENYSNYECLYEQFFG